MDQMPDARGARRPLQDRAVADVITRDLPGTAARAMSPHDTGHVAVTVPSGSDGTGVPMPYRIEPVLPEEPRTLRRQDERGRRSTMSPD